jgi:tellurite resistance protein TerC
VNAVSLFPFADYWPHYLGFIAFVVAVLFVDLGLFHRTAHRVSFRESVIWSVIWVSLALCFNLLLYVYAQWKFQQDPRLLAIEGFQPLIEAKRVALEFFTGYVIEKSLAVDNIFVFVMVFAYFNIPNEYQHRILFYGILGALIFRAIFIALGSVLMQYYWFVIFFGAFLIFTGIKMFFASDEKIEPEKNPIIKLVRKVFPVTPQLHGQNFFVRINGKLWATPLFVTLIFIEVSDIIFAIDSVPAIFAITREPFIVFTSNIFAILGLRAMYFMLASLVDKFTYLKFGLAFILVFVGLKMVWLNEAFGGKFPIKWSLGIIGGILFLSMVPTFFGKTRQPKS